MKGLGLMSKDKKPYIIHETGRGTIVTVIPLEGYNVILTESADGQVDIMTTCNLEVLVDVFPRMMLALDEEGEKKRRKREVDRKKKNKKSGKPYG